MSKTRKTIYGTFFGILEKLINIILPFIVRTIIIKKLGADYLGLNSLFTSILSVLNLAELGFGSAVIFSMYKPINDNNYDEIHGILNFLKKIYKYIGITIFIIGLFLLPFLKSIISGEVPSDINLYIVYLIFLINTCLSYLLFAYKSSLLNALQCNYEISRVNVFFQILMNTLQIIVLLCFENFYFYAIIIPLITIFNNLYISHIVNKNYNRYLGIGNISDESKNSIKKRLFPLISTKIAAILLTSADTIVISMFLGLSDVAIYNNYYYIVNAVMGFLIVLYNSMQAGIGNSLIKDSKAKILQDFNMFCFMNQWLVVVCTCCMLNLYQNFIYLWLGSDMMLSNYLVFLFCTYFYANTIQRIVVIYKDAAGLWKEDMVRCYCSCLLNILINVLTIKYIGLYGVIGSTVIANLVGLPLMGKILFKHQFKYSSKDFYISEIIYSLVALFICFITYNMCMLFDYSILSFVIRLVISIIVSNFILFIIYFKTNNFKLTFDWIKNKFIKERS